LYLDLNNNNLSKIPLVLNYVYPRPNTAEHNFKTHPKVKFVEAPLLDISATFIRNSIKAGKSIRYMVSDVVDEYIRWKKFYL
jgi:nicotinate-nucleotide adenylyltransferase